MGLSGALGGIYGGPMGSGRTLRGLMQFWEDPMGVLWCLGGPLGDLFGLGKPYGSKWGSGRTLWGSTGLWDDLGVTYGDWGNPMDLIGALGGSYRVWEDSMWVNGALGGPLGAL